MPETSEETQRYFKLEKCSDCDARPYSGKWTKKPSFRLSSRDGTEIAGVVDPTDSGLKLTAAVAAISGVLFPPAGIGVAFGGGINALARRRRRRAIQDITCTNCGHRWSFYRQDASPPRFEIVDTGTTSEELIDTEEFLINNSGSPGEYEKQLSLQRQWSKSLWIAYEEGQKVGSEVSAGLPQGAGSLKSNIERQLKTSFTITDSETTTYTEVTTLKVPARTRVWVSVEWKQIWRHGQILVYDQGGGYSAVPFKVAVKVRPDVTPEVIT